MQIIIGFGFSFGGQFNESIKNFLRTVWISKTDSVLKSLLLFLFLNLKVIIYLLSFYQLRKGKEKQKENQKIWYKSWQVMHIDLEQRNA